MLASKDINDLISIVAALRNPESGCAWNIKQTFESIIPYMLEEAYEVIDAIERGNRTDLCEELGDLLLQVVYHAMIATEERSFTFEDVVYVITAKMIRRHPHVFGNTEQKSRGFVEGMWEHIKKIEKAEQTKQYEKISVPDNELASYLIQENQLNQQIKKPSHYKKQLQKLVLSRMIVIKLLQKSKKNSIHSKKQ
ncbi:ATP diphosphatase [Bartonella sp. CDC_skunk]|nr:ATP diphosphatase [Bartonella sp. CDC_skunk]AQX26526.1 ATP diphosphatase [Bartonella sp. Raccoon60]